MQAVLHALVRDFFTQMGISFDRLEFRCQDEAAHIYEARIETVDSKILIGIHGQTLDHIKHLLSRMGEKLTQERCTIHLEVNDYVKNRDERLYRYLDTKILEVQTSGQSIVLDQLTSYERKKTHDYIQSKNIPGITARSEGEGSERRLHILNEKHQHPTTDLSEEGV